MVAIEIDTKPAELHRMSLDEYHRLIESGGFDEDARIELIDGLLVDMSPRTVPHDYAIEWLDEVLHRELDTARFRVRAGLALTLGTSEPEPDLAVVERNMPQPYHPGRAALVIEVSVSSLRRDLLQKPLVYARAGIPLYWVLDLDGRRAVVHSEPGPAGYARVETHGADGELAAPQIGLPPIGLAELFAAAHG